MHSTSLESDVQLLDEEGHKLHRPDIKLELLPARIRLCLECDPVDLDAQLCQVEHLKMARQKKIVTSTMEASRRKDTCNLTALTDDSKPNWARRTVEHLAKKSFQRDLSTQEDRQHFKSQTALNGSHHVFTRLVASAVRAGDFMDNLSPLVRASPFVAPMYHHPGRMPIQLKRTKITPAGTYHLSMKFGTILVGSGVESVTAEDIKYTSNRGILVSPRFNTNLLADKKAASTLLYRTADRIEATDTQKAVYYATCCNLYATRKLKDSPSHKQVRLLRRPIDDRNSLACMKMVYSVLGSPQLFLPSRDCCRGLFGHRGSPLSSHCIPFQNRGYGATSTLQRCR